MKKCLSVCLSVHEGNVSLGRVKAITDTIVVIPPEVYSSEDLNLVMIKKKILEE